MEGGASSVERGFDRHSASLQDMGVDHGGTNILMPKKFLNRSYIIAVLEQVGGEGVSEGVACGTFADASLLNGHLDITLQPRRVKMMTTLRVGTRIQRAFGRGEQVLPDEFGRGIGVFCMEGAGEIHLPAVDSHIFFMKEADLFDLALEIGQNDVGQGSDAVLFALAIAHGNGPVVEIHILDAQADTFHETQTRTIEKLSHEFVRTVKLVYHSQGFGMGEDRGETFGAFGIGQDDRVDVLVKDFAIEEENCAERLVLGGSRHPALGGEVCKEGMNFGRFHVFGMAPVVEEDEAASPINICLFGTEGVVFEAKCIAHLVEKFFCHGELTFLVREV